MRTVKEIVESRIEPAEPQTTILRILKENEDKRLDQRIAKKLVEATGDSSIRLRKEAGMTSIEWGGYSISGGRKGGNLFVSYKVVDVLIDTSFIENNNAAYFSAREQRNQERQSHTDQDYSNLEEAFEVYKTARKHLKNLLEKFDADKYTLIKEILDEERI